MPVLVHRANISLTPCGDGEVTDNGCCSAHVAIRQLVDDIDLIIHPIPISLVVVRRETEALAIPGSCRLCLQILEDQGKYPPQLPC